MFPNDFDGKDPDPDPDPEENITDPFEGGIAASSHSRRQKRYKLKYAISNSWISKHGWDLYLGW